jgi:hypothetical protein
LACTVALTGAPARAAAITISRVRSARGLLGTDLDFGACGERFGDPLKAGASTFARLVDT